MSQSSLSIPNESGATARAGFNSALQAVDSMFAGATDPSTKSMSYAYMFWIDTGNKLVKQRNSANDTWCVRGHIDSNGCIVWDSNMVTLASASTMAIGGADGEIISVTGTTTITAFDSPSGNPHRTLIFGSALTVTYSASAIILPGSANITVSAGDVMEFVYEGNGIWQCVNYFKNSKLANVAYSGDYNDLSNKPALNSILTGVILEYAGSTAPTGYLLCDGSAVSRTTYAALFAVIGTVYGTGDGSTTFNIPNKQGRVGIGVSSSYSIGTTGGEATHQLTINEMPSHTHTVNFFRNGYGDGNSNMSIEGGVSDYQPYTKTSSSVGGDNAHNNMPPYIAVNYIIKT